MDPLEPFKDLWTVYSLIKQVREIATALGAGMQRMHRSNTVQDTIAYARVMAHSTVFPTILERLDDGTNPEQQRLRIDMSLAFSQDRIDNALYYRASQSIKNLVEQFWNEVRMQASKGLQPGDERTVSVILDYMDHGAFYNYLIHGQVGGDWYCIRLPEQHLNRQQLWRKAREIQAQYLARYDAKHNTASLR